MEVESPSGPLSSISAPTLVIHGPADPMFPVEHAEALAHEIPDARLLRLEGAGHGIDPADRETIAAAIIDHTVAADRTRVRAIEERHRLVAELTRRDGSSHRRSTPVR